MTATSRRLFLVLALLGLLAAACGGPDTSATSAPATTTTEEMADDEKPMDDEMGDVLEVAAAEGDLGVFLAALEAAGIMDDFHGEGPFTLFIPTDEAFTTYLEEAGMSRAEVFAGTEMLQAIVSYHVVDMFEDAEMVMGMAGQTFTTAAGLPLEVTVENDIVMVGGATVERYDLQASNGVIHVIDTVLIPPDAP